MRVQNHENVGHDNWGKYAALYSLCHICTFIIDLGIPHYSSSFWLAALGIGGLGTAVAYLLWNKGIQIANANEAGIFINVVPLSTAAFSLVFGETLYTYHLVSGILIILGVFTLLKK